MNDRREGSSLRGAEVRDGATRLRLCFVSPYSYPLFNPACISPFGGSEVRLSSIAKALARYPDLDVSVIVFDHGQSPVERREGVEIYAWPGRYCPVLPDDPVGMQQARQGSLRTTDPKAAPVTGGAGLAAQDPAKLPLRHRFRLVLKGQLPYFLFPVYRRLRPAMSLAGSAIRAVFGALGGRKPFGYIRGHAVRNSDVSIYDAVGADLYVTRSNSDHVAHLACYCKRHAKKVVLLSGSDYDFAPVRRTTIGGTDLYGSMTDLMEYALEAADLVIVQNQAQADSAKAHFGRDTAILPNPIDLTPAYPRAAVPDRILWVGKSDDRVKQPDLFLDLVERLPGFRYVMILNLCIDSVHRRILKRAETLPSLCVVPYVPFNEVERYFADAKLLVNTSVFEGFPNTFLQAAKYGVPTVSLKVDPERMFSQHGSGLHCEGDFGRLVEGVSRLMSDEQAYREASRRCRAYVAGCHDERVIVRQFRELLTGLMTGVEDGRPQSSADESG